MTQAQAPIVQWLGEGAVDDAWGWAGKVRAAKEIEIVPHGEAPQQLVNMFWASDLPSDCLPRP